jgi:hypothetical protein
MPAVLPPDQHPGVRGQQALDERAAICADRRRSPVADSAAPRSRLPQQPRRRRQRHPAITQDPASAASHSRRDRSSSASRRSWSASRRSSHRRITPTPAAPAHSSHHAKLHHTSRSPATRQLLNFLMIPKHAQGGFTGHPVPVFPGHGRGYAVLTGLGRPDRGQLVAAASPVKTARMSPMAGSRPTGSGSGRCAWIW